MTLHNLRRLLLLAVLAAVGAGTLPALAHWGNPPVVPPPNAAAPIAGVQIDGPITGTLNIAGTFTATVTPISATLPITYTWESSESAPRTLIHNAIRFVWRTPGLKTVTVTVSNSDTLTPVVQTARVYIESVRPDGFSTVVGKIYDTREIPLPGAVVTIIPDGGGPGEQRTLTDPSGTYTFTGLLPGRYRINASATDHLPAALDEPITVGIIGAAPYPLLLDQSDAARAAYYLTMINGKEPATDSASAATALATGHKTDDGNIAWLPGDPAGGQLTNIAEQLRAEQGFAIGAVSTVPFSHATPACFISHNVHRDNYFEIAHEAIFSTTPEIVIGGGHYLYNTKYISASDFLALSGDTTAYTYVGRQAGIDGALALSNTAATLNFAAGDRLFGLFGGPNGSVEFYQVADAPGSPAVTRIVTENPTLADSVNATLPFLSQDPQGFFVLFEQGDIDWSNHENNYTNMIGGIWDLDRAVRAAEAFIDQPGGPDWSDTLILLTADHSTGHLRLPIPLGRGDLPAQEWQDTDGDGAVDNGEWRYPNGEVAYSSVNHVNELVALQAHGAGAALLEDYAGTWYPGTRIVDNTQIHAAMRRAAQEAGATHIILFVGDGMSLASEIAGSRYLYGIDNGLAWHAWGGRPDGWIGYAATWDVTAYNKYAAVTNHAAYSRTQFDPRVGYDVQRSGPAPYPRQPENTANETARAAYYLTMINGKEPATDSASAATALATGHKTDDGNIAWLPGDPAGGQLTNIAEQLRAEQGFAIGAVSTVPFSHATPACFISHNVHRDNYFEIAHEAIFSTTPEIVIGGGHYLYNTKYISASDFLALSGDTTAYTYVGRQAGVDGALALSNTAATLNFAAGDRLFGLFGGPNGSVEFYQVADAPGSPAVTRIVTENPTLADSVNAALPFLSQDPQGFFVLFEQGDIDWSNHENNYTNMIGGIWDLDRAVRAAEAFIDQPGGPDWSDTLILLTADHSTGHLRLPIPLGRGDLPAQEWQDTDGDGAVDNGEWRYPNGEVAYSSVNHVNELVALQAHGAGAALLEDYAGTWYPGTRIVDNTQIHAAMRRAAQEAGATHIILFVGDGMSLASEIAGSRYLYGIDNGLAWHAWGERPDGWIGYAATWDVTTYNKYAATLNRPGYNPTNFDPTTGFNSGGVLAIISDLNLAQNRWQIRLPVIFKNAAPGR